MSACDALSTILLFFKNLAGQCVAHNDPCPTFEHVRKPLLLGAYLRRDHQVLVGCSLPHDPSAALLRIGGMGCRI